MQLTPGMVQSLKKVVDQYSDAIGKADVDTVQQNISSNPRLLDGLAIAEVFMFLGGVAGDTSQDDLVQYLPKDCREDARELLESLKQLAQVAQAKLEKDPSSSLGDMASEKPQAYSEIIGTLFNLLLVAGKEGLKDFQEEMAEIDSQSQPGNGESSEAST